MLAVNLETSGFKISCSCLACLKMLRYFEDGGVVTDFQAETCSQLSCFATCPETAPQTACHSQLDSLLFQTTYQQQLEVEVTGNLHINMLNIITLPDEYVSKPSPKNGWSNPKKEFKNILFFFKCTQYICLGPFFSMKHTRRSWISSCPIATDPLHPPAMPRVNSVLPSSVPKWSKPQLRSQRMRRRTFPTSGRRGESTEVERKRLGKWWNMENFRNMLETEGKPKVEWKLVYCFQLNSIGGSSRRNG